MFTGIIEKLGVVNKVEKEGTNLHLSIQADFTDELKVDQSVAHNGVCLTVVNIEGDVYTVTAIKETLDKTSTGSLKVDDLVNLERCMKIGDRVDGHMVYGHVDSTGKCLSRVSENGSTLFTFSFGSEYNNLVVEKGSVCINGISLTVFDVKDGRFSVAIIPYTLEHTNLKNIYEGDELNLEFDIFGKYLDKHLKNITPKA